MIIGGVGCYVTGGVADLVGVMYNRWCWMLCNRRLLLSWRGLCVIAGDGCNLIGGCCPARGCFNLSSATVVAELACVLCRRRLLPS